MRALAAAGYRAIAPDQRGYGETSAPEAAEAYTIHHLVGDLTGLLDALSIERAVVVGHDWGGSIAWGMAQLAPHRVAGVVGHQHAVLSAPADAADGLLMRAMAQGSFHYILYFQKPGVAEAELDADRRARWPASSSRRIASGWSELLAAGPAALGPKSGGLLELPATPHGDFLTADDFAVYVDAFRKTGFRGGLNWYRNFDRNWELTAYLHGAKVMPPALMITADLDPVLRPEPPPA